MASRTLVTLLILLSVGAAGAPLDAQRAGRVAPDTRRFYPDDPLWQDDDRRDTPPVAKQQLSATYDLLENTYASPAKSRGPMAAISSIVCWTEVGNW